MNELEMLKLKYSFYSTKESSQAWYDNKKVWTTDKLCFFINKQDCLKLHWVFELMSLQTDTLCSTWRFTESDALKNSINLEQG